MKFHADLVVELPQFLELLLCDVQFLSGVEVDRVDEQVRMDVLPVCVGADQNFVALIVLRQFQRRRMGGDRIDCFAFRKALHHVVEQHAIGFVVEPLGSHEVRVDRFWLAVDTGDQPLPLELSFLILHGVPHHSAHASGGLAPLVVGEADDRHTHHRFRSRIMRTASQSSENVCRTLSRSTTVTRPMCASVTS